MKFNHAGADDELMLVIPAPMSANERQRRCRARGKGRHRGGLSKQARLEVERQSALEWAKLIAAPPAGAEVAPAANSAAAQAATPPQPETPPAEPKRIFATELNVSLMAA